MNKIRYIAILLLMLAGGLHPATATAAENGEVDVNHLVFGHIGDAYEWHIATLGDTELKIPLPVIVHSSTG